MPAGTASAAMPLLLYLYDPLCGWCYGATPALEALEREQRWRLRLLPTGLFGGDPQRRLDPAMEAHIWQADQRIAALSGQPFTEAYRARVLRSADMRFDSAPATLALSAVAQHAPARERAALAAMQKARWVEGLDITQREVLIGALSAASGEPAGTWAERLDEPGLPRFMQERLQRAALLMQRFGLSGVPGLIALPALDESLDEAALAARALREGREVPGQALFDGSLPRVLGALQTP